MISLWLWDRGNGSAPKKEWDWQAGMAAGGLRRRLRLWRDGWLWLWLWPRHGDGTGLTGGFAPHLLPAGYGGTAMAMAMVDMGQNRATGTGQKRQGPLTAG